MDGTSLFIQQTLIILSHIIIFNIRYQGCQVCGQIQHTDPVPIQAKSPQI